MTEPVVAWWFWQQYDTDDLAERAQAMRTRSINPDLSGMARSAALMLADEMTAELARRAMEEAA